MLLTNTEHLLFQDSSGETKDRSAMEQLSTPPMTDSWPLSVFASRWMLSFLGRDTLQPRDRQLQIDKSRRTQN